MQLPIIIQARMSSERLPGKVLSKIGTMEMLLWVIRRLEHCSKTSDCVVATSTEASDDDIEEFCNKHSIRIFRGSLNNVAERFLNTATALNSESFVRICADSPLIDPKLVDQAISIYSGNTYDLLTNTQIRTYPKGQSVEIYNTKILSVAMKNFLYAEDYEHIARHFYKNSENFSIYSMECKTNLSDKNMCVDTPEDLDRITRIINQLGQEQVLKADFIQLANYF